MNSQQRFRCDSCDMTYQSSSNLRRHIDQIHSDNPTYPCSKCSKRCGGKNELKRHLQTHDTDNFFKSTCSSCGKKFKTKESLNHHIKRSHIKENIHECVWEKISLRSRNEKTSSSPWNKNIKFILGLPKHVLDLIPPTITLQKHGISSCHVTAKQ